MTERLTILEVNDIEKVGAKNIPKLGFRAKGVDSNEYPYFTFRTSLFDYIKKDTTIEADVETKTREYQGNIYHDRKVTEIYVGGQPVGEKKKAWGGSQESPAKQASIEGMFAVREVGDMIRAKIPVEKQIEGRYWYCLDTMLHGFCNGEEAKKEPKQDTESTSKRVSPSSKDIMPFYTKCHEKLGLQPGELLRRLSEIRNTQVTKDTIGDLDAAFEQLQKVV